MKILQKVVLQLEKIRDEEKVMLGLAMVLALALLKIILATAEIGREIISDRISKKLSGVKFFASLAVLMVALVVVQIVGTYVIYIPVLVGLLIASYEVFINRDNLVEVKLEDSKE